MCLQSDDQAASPQAEALKVGSLPQGHQWFVGFAACPCPDGPLPEALRDKHVLSICPLFLQFILRNLFNKKTPMCEPEAVQCGKKQDTSRMPDVSVFKR